MRVKSILSALWPRARATAGGPPRAPRADGECWRVLGFLDGPPRSRAVLEARFRLLAATRHPDRGGSTEAMQRLLVARREARRRLGAPRPSPAG